VRLLGRDLHTRCRPALRAARRDFQMVFQDPYGSLDPRQTVERIVAEPLAAQGDTTPGRTAQRAAEVLDAGGPARQRPGQIPA
jgi:peptide/nickel transport system ATP-binding protein